MTKPFPLPGLECCGTFHRALIYDPCRVDRCPKGGGGWNEYDRVCRFRSLFAFEEKLSDRGGVGVRGWAQRGVPDQTRAAMGRLDPASEAIHHISRDELMAQGRHHEMVAQTMLNDLAGHDLRASAPSWDGKWLSTLLRASGLSRHSLRLRGTDAARREVAQAIFSARWTDGALDREVEALLDRVASCEAAGTPAHRALADARDERRRWVAVRNAALDHLGISPGQECPP
ncbi:hypothetical protein [Sphingobium sp. SA916]|uniref:hypothetical protein n=1 Tax=Sphingobium sp. SA916 TaxID=1851207 RepID=UPI00209C3376|nr:hypothetical protein [Sphingobium sp. SA916]